MDERRESPRRSGERREFRRTEGRRDPEAVGRRRSLRRYVLPLFVLLTPLLLGGVYRHKIVVPREQTEVLAGEVGARVRSVLSETALPGLNFPGAAAPRPIPPWSEKIHPPSERRADFANACARLPEGLVGVREVPAIGRAGALCSLLLGEYDVARARWERVVAYGVPQQVSEAKLGLGVLAIRQGISTADPQDRTFAWDRAETLFRGVSSDDVVGSAARSNLVALESLRYPDTDVLLRSSEQARPGGGQPLGED